MTDDLERRIRASFEGAKLPGAPEATREALESVVSEPRLPVRTLRPRWLLFVGAVASIIAAVSFVAGSRPATSSTEPPPSGSLAAPSATPSELDGMRVYSVGELLAARAAGDVPGGPYALTGYWTNRQIMHSCVPPPPSVEPGVLEIRCSDGEWGITEQDEAILEVNLETGEVHPATGPHLTPYVPAESDQAALFGTVDGRYSSTWAPVPITVVGHFDDPLASACQPKQRQTCLDRFVIDRIVAFDPAVVPPPTAPPTPTPFPFDDPPPALFTDDRCYGGVPKSFTGWTTMADLNIQVDPPGYYYAMITRDVIAIGGWYNNSTYPGHRTRWRGQGVCYSNGYSGLSFGSVRGTTYLEVDDGRHIPGDAP